MPTRVKVLVRWAKAVRGVDRVWWKPYTVHSAPVRWLRRRPAQVYVPVEKFVEDVEKASAGKLKAECKRAGLDVTGGEHALRARLLAIVGVDYEPPEEAGAERDIRDVLDRDNGNEMRRLLADLSEESIGSPRKPEIRKRLEAMLEAADE